MEKKFDFTPKQWVLVRVCEFNTWTLSIFSHYNEEGKPICINTAIWNEAIPFEGNEHLLGTTDDYVEPYEPQDGDFVVYVYPNGNTYVCIYQCTDNNLIDNYYADYTLENNSYKPKTVNFNDGFDTGYSERRPATEEEKQQLLDALHKEGNDWSEEKKEIVEYKWRPEFKEQYWSIIFDNEEWKFKASLFRWYNVKISKIHLDQNIVFKYKEDAEKEAEKRNELLLKGEK